MASYLYYVQDFSPLRDTDYDLLCKRLKEEFPKINHKFKSCITEADLDAGSGYAIPQSIYPFGIKSAAAEWRRILEGT